jgi:Transcription factor WhiB
MGANPEVRQFVVTVRDQAPLALLTDRALRAEVTSEARCADGTLDPDEWFPVSTDAEAARREAAGAIAVCGACPVRDACQELSMRHWRIGQHGVWGGLVPAERAAVRRQRLESARRDGHSLSAADLTAGGTPAPAPVAL